MQNKGLKPPSSFSSTNTPRWYLSLHPKAQIRPTASIDQGSMLKVYTSSVRFVLEYAMPVWQSIPGYLSDKIESMQKRVLKIIFLCADSYSDALELAWVETPAYRRDKICKEYMCKMKDLNHPLHSLLPKRLDDTCHYTLGSAVLCRNITTCRAKCTEDFFTFKYF